MFCIKGELDKSRQTLDGLKREQGQLNANLEKVNFWYFTITYEHWMLIFNIQNHHFGQYKYISSFIKIEALEEKIRSEMESLNVKISGMEEGLTTYSDLER